MHGNNLHTFYVPFACSLRKSTWLILLVNMHNLLVGQVKLNKKNDHGHITDVLWIFFLDFY